jgi:hypothetical protein
MPEWDRLQPGRGQFGRHQVCSVPPDAFPAKAGPTVRAKINPTGCMRCLSGTGFSREEASLAAIKFAVCLPTPSRLKPVPLCRRSQLSHYHCIRFCCRRCVCVCFCSSYAKGPNTAKRDLGAGRAQVLRSGPSRMDAARAPLRTWMSVRRGPTEQDRSDGTRRRRAKPGADTLGYLGCFFQVTRRRRNVCR